MKCHIELKIALASLFQDEELFTSAGLFMSCVLRRLKVVVFDTYIAR